MTKKYGAATVLNDVNISFEKGKQNGTKILIEIPHTEEEQNI